MSITEAFEGVLPVSPAAPAAPRRPSPRPRPVAVPIRTLRASPVRRLARVVYVDGRDSWIAQERSPSAATVWRTDYLSGLNGPPRVVRVWAATYKPVAVTAALLLDAVKWLLINPFLGPPTVLAATVIYLFATL